MAGDIDLYGDLVLDENPFVGEPVLLDAPQKVAAEMEDSEAVQALLKQLHAAKDLRLDADLELDSDLEDGMDVSETVLADEPDSVVFLGIDEEPSGPSKRQRLNPPTDQPAQRSARGASSLDALDFDFEADLPVASSAMCSRGPAAPLKSSERGNGAKKSETEYWFNPETKRYEPRDAAKEKEVAMRAAEARFAARNAYIKQSKVAGGKGGGRGTVVKRGPAPGYKTDLCWQFSRGSCKKGDRCYWAHGTHELRSGADAEILKKRIIAECVAEARTDTKPGFCEYPQALVVRLALRFEEKPDAMLANMAQAGLPAGADQRTTVKALMRLCHPDKCHHPEAKKAMQILGPLLTKK